MAVTFPLSLPSGLRPSKVRIRPLAVVAVSTSPFSLAQQAYEWPGARWEADLEFPRMGEAKGRAMDAFLTALRGRRGTFLLGDPAGETPRGIATGTPVVDGADQTGLTLATRGWTASQTGILLAGDWVQLGTGISARLHKVTQDADSDASGDATLDIWPALRSSPADGDALTVSNAQGVFRLSDTVQWSIEAPALYEFSFSAVEAL